MKIGKRSLSRWAKDHRDEFLVALAEPPPPPDPKWRKRRPYLQWRRTVLERDGHRCQHCRAPDQLTVHHVCPAALFPQFRYLLCNGITLCDKCHTSYFNEIHRMDEEFWLRMLRLPQKGP